MEESLIEIFKNLNNCAQNNPSYFSMDSESSQILLDYINSLEEKYETAKDDILFLYFHNFMCDSEKDKAINKLHKKLMFNIKKRSE